MTKHYTLFIATGLLLTSTIGTVASDQSTPSTNDEVQITETVRSMFAALSAEDIPKLRAIVAPDFYAFEAGGRITGEALIDLMKKAHAAGKVYAFTHSGSIVVHKLKGPICVQNNSGRIEATEIAGAIDAQTGSGAIRLLQVTPAPIRVLFK